MSESKFTPGPWRVSEEVAYGYDIYANADERGKCKWIGQAHSAELLDSSENEAITNASLIAAAPDMYAVLKDLEESADYWSEYDVPIGIVDRIKAALAKAEGKNHE